MTKRIATALSLSLALTIPALAQDRHAIHTGGETGAYHSHFCPALTRALDQRGTVAECRSSAGTVDNMTKVADDPTSFGYGQLDVFALSAESFGGSKVFSQVRVDDARECVFAVTKAKDLTNYGEVAVFAPQLKFYLPPEKSGSTSTFRYLQGLDPEGLGQAQNIEIAASTDDAIRKALTTQGGVAFFVQFPDAQNPRFRMIQDLGGHVVPVIDRAILAQELDGRAVYFAQETQVTNTRWLAASRTVVTACTPLVLFAGNPEEIEDAEARRRQSDLITAIRGMNAQQVLPQASFFSRIVKRTKELSSASAERLVTLSDTARERAKPLLERAREAGGQLYERAKDGAQIMIDKAKPAAENTR